MPDISVICSVKNGGRYIEETVNSVLRQTYEAWELIIVDDGSSDDTLEKLQQMARVDSRIKVFSTSGIGRGKALNLALRHSGGSKIANIDADDPSHPQRLEILGNLLNAHKDFSLVGSSFVVLMGDENPTWRPVNPTSIPVRDITPLLPRSNPLIHSSVLVRKEDLREAGGYNETIDTHFDYELWIRMAGKGYRLGKAELPLASKRAHSRQSFEAKRRFKYLMNSLSHQRKAIEELGFSRTAYLFLMLRFITGFLPRIMRQRLKKALKKLLERR